MTPRCRRSAAADDSDGLDVEFSRLLCDYEPSASRRYGLGKVQAIRGVDGWPAAVLNAELRMRQVDHATSRLLSRAGSCITIRRFERWCPKLLANVDIATNQHSRPMDQDR